MTVKTARVKNKASPVRARVVASWCPGAKLKNRERVAR